MWELKALYLPCGCPLPPQQTLDHYPGFLLLWYGGENPTSWKFSPSPPRKIPPSRLTKGFQNSIKGNLCYKMITSQNVPPKAQIMIFFISYKNYVPFSRYSSFCIFNHPMIYQISDVTMSISTWDKVHFLIYLLNHKSWSHQTWPADRYQQVQ